MIGISGQLNILCHFVNYTFLLYIHGTNFPDDEWYLDFVYWGDAQGCILKGQNDAHRGFSKRQNGVFCKTRASKPVATGQMKALYGNPIFRDAN